MKRAEFLAAPYLDVSMQGLVTQLFLFERGLEIIQAAGIVSSWVFHVAPVILFRTHSRLKLSNFAIHFKSDNSLDRRRARLGRWLAAALSCVANSLRRIKRGVGCNSKAGIITAECHHIQGPSR